MHHQALYNMMSKFREEQGTKGAFLMFAYHEWPLKHFESDSYYLDSFWFMRDEMFSSDNSMMFNEEQDVALKNAIKNGVTATDDVIVVFMCVAKVPIPGDTLRMKRTAILPLSVCKPSKTLKPIHLSGFHEHGKANGPRACNFCGMVPTKPQRCGDCQAVFYCDKLCQKRDWKAHKLTCSHRTEGFGGKAWSRYGGKVQLSWPDGLMYTRTFEGKASMSAGEA